MNANHEPSVDYITISKSEKTHITISREEFAEIIDSFDGLTLQCQRLLHRFQRLSMRLVDEKDGTK